MSLDLVTAVRAEERHLVHGFDTFGDDPEPKLVRHADDGEDDRGIICIGRDVADKRPVDLDHVDWKALEIGEARITGSEVVNGDARSGRPQHVQNARGLVRARHC